ncbi:TPA: hypothetical protein HA251_07320 [Candidatus Woesearchaeota archaeon]|nr:hypothetical protein [Candidatus Woesearchaeota archaeon]
MELKELRIPLILIAAIMLVGSAYYIFSVAPNAPVMADASLYDGARFKTGFLPDGAFKVFVSASNNKLMMLDAAEGELLPESRTMVLGSAEAAMMREEKLFTNINDTLEGFFGIDIAIGGVLKARGDLADDAHFLTERQFAAVQGEEGRISVKTEPDGSPKFFYRYATTDALPEITLAEGDITDYKTTELEGKTYYPVILGAKEATMMRENRLFNKPGDTIDGLFGNDAIIVGVLEETGSALDMMHLVTAESGYVG